MKEHIENAMADVDAKFRDYDRNVSNAFEQIEKEFSPDISVWELIKDFFVKLFKK